MKKIAVLASYNGSGFLAVHEAIINKNLDYEICVVISNNFDATVLEKAREFGIENHVINDKTCTNPNEKIFDVLDSFAPDFVLLSGFMKKIDEKIVSKFNIINCHPSLLPKYGGKGMYGSFVHRAVFENGDQISGCTIHFVSENYDEGEIVLQKTVNIAECKTYLEVEEKVKNLEKIAIVEAFCKL